MEAKEIGGWSPMEAGKQRPGTTGSCFMGPRLIAENHFLAIILLEQFHSRNEGHGLDNSLEQFYSHKWRPWKIGGWKNSI